VALKRNSNGTYTITSKTQAVKAIKLAKELGAEIEALRQEPGIGDMEMDSAEMMRAACAYMTDKEMDRVELGDGRYAVRIAAEYDKHWILTDDELDALDNPSGAKSLRRILKKKFKKPEEFKMVLKAITKRVADPIVIDQLCKDGILNEKEIAPALVAKTKRPHLRVYGEGDSE
jgi:hypothetical protein